MAAQLDLTGDRRRLPAGLLLAGLAAALVAVVALTGPAAAVLAGSVAAGCGLTYLSGLELRAEERLAAGALAGTMLFCAVAFLLALAAGLTAGTVLGALLVTCAAGAAGWWQGRTRVRPELLDAAARWRAAEPWPLWVLLAICWPFTLLLLAHAYQVTPDGLVAGNVGVYADWALHLTFTSSFAYGANFPPQFPIYPGHGMTYPFMVDFWAACLVELGTPLTSALVLTSGFLGLALPAIAYFAWLRLAGDRAAAALAVFVALLSGGLGFVLLAGDLRAGGLATLANLPRLYTQAPDLNLQWLNPVLGWLLPQRSILFGFAVVPLVLGLLWSARTAGRWQPYAFAGVLTGLAPLFHLHAFGTALALGVFWALLTPRRQWAAFFVPAVVLGAPVALWLSSGGAAALRVQPGWLAAAEGHGDNAVWFWLWNTGALVPAMAAAFLWRGTLPDRLAVHLAPIWLWFLVPNVIVFQPWDWDNTKFLGYWLLVGALPVGLLLARLWRLRPAAPVGRVVAAALFVLLTLAGALDLGRALEPVQNEALFTDAAGLRAATWAREHTDPHAVFLVAPLHNEPVPAFSGRPVVAGYPGWLWTYGFPDWMQRTEEVQQMLQGGPETARLVQRYGVRYVVVGPEELGTFRANQRYWETAGQAVYSDGGYTIYRVRGA